MISVGLDLIVQSTTKSSILLMGSEVLINPYPATNYFTPKQVKNTLNVWFSNLYYNSNIILYIMFWDMGDM